MAKNKLRNVPTQGQGHPFVESALRTLDAEADGINALAAAIHDGLGQSFIAAVELIRSAKGRLIVTGMGKSGHIARKIAATFASTGTPAFFVHPGEASHGDLGMITRDDVILALSWSGETVELKNIITFSRRFAVPLISLTSREDSALAQQSDVALLLPRAREACPHGLAPTTSTTMQLALGDALAIALLEERGFSIDDFALLHPAGALGRRLRRVEDLMHRGGEVPLVHADASLKDTLLEMTSKRLGLTGVVDADGELIGVVTDGDLRRGLESTADVRTLSARDLMVRHRRSDRAGAPPKTIAAGALAAEAVALMERHAITSLFILADGTRRPIGVIHLHDLLRAGLV